MSEEARKLQPESLLIARGRPSGAGSPVNTSVTFNSTYHAGGEVVYAREGNPTWTALEDVLGTLEGGTCLAYASGTAAAAAALPAQARVVMTGVAYHGIHQLAKDRAEAGRLALDLVDVSDTGAVTAACEGAAVLWLETPTNPLLDVADVVRLSEIAHAQGALVVVDNTFATPMRQRPLELGADLVLHSATKFLGGHSDLLLGALVGRDEELLGKLRRRRVVDGAVPGVMESFLALRGLRTLAVRLDRAERSAGELARRLAEHPAVMRVRYPGLPDHPGHELAVRQMSGFGAMLAFETVGDAAAAERVCDAVRLITHATSLGGVETMLERRARYPGDAAAGTPPTLIRLSVGLESADDLWSDLERALDQLSG
jgi:cystathionine gamma-synthase